MNKKGKKITIISVIVLCVVCVIVFIYLNVDVKKIDEGGYEEEIVPEEEISDEQLRETTISIYFIDKNNEIKDEMKKVDSKKLINDPYSVAMELLINGTDMEGLKSYIPNNVKINKIEKHGECLLIDFSKEFIESMEDDVEVQGLAISQIVNTMTQFTEINAIKIVIDGQENLAFKNGNISFEQLFTHED